MGDGPRSEAYPKALQSELFEGSLRSTHFSEVSRWASGPGSSSIHRGEEEALM